MRVLFLSSHCCIRVVKQSLALQKAGGVEVIHLQHRLANQDSAFLINNHNFYKHEITLRFKLQNYFSDVDLIHVHNEPHNLATIARSVLPDMPIVFDAHDLDTARTRKDHTSEREAIESSDGIITPSLGYEMHVKEWYRLPPNYPTITVYSFCTDDMTQIKRRSKLGGIVYQGGLSISTPQLAALGAYSYRDWRSAAMKLAKLKIPFHLYGAGADDVLQYLGTDAVLHCSVPFTSLIGELSRYDWGMVGCSFVDAAFEWAMPNKLFEYMAAGVPLIVMNAPEAAEFVKKHDIGVVVDSIEDIPAIYDQHHYYKTMVAKKASEFSMESQVPSILNFYKTVIERKKNGTKSDTTEPVS